MKIILKRKNEVTNQKSRKNHMKMQKSFVFAKKNLKINV